MKLLAVSAALVTTMAASAHAGDVGGTYDVRGTNFDGSPYSGTAQIIMTSSRTCEVTWQTGGEAKGLCMVDGDRLLASYSFPNGGGDGLVSYAILKDGALDGVWTSNGVEGIGTEVMTPNR